MLVVIQALGSRGDVQPFLALGQMLKQAGHDVRLATSQEFAVAVEQAGLAWAPLHIDFKKIMTKHAGQEAIGSLRGAIKAAREVKPLMRIVLDDAWAASSGADLLIYHPKILAGPHIAEKLGIPALIALPMPGLSPTAAFPTPLFRWPVWSGLTNRFSHHLVLAATRLGYRGMIDAWRDAALGLPPAATVKTSMLNVLGKPVPRLYGFSEALVSRPADWTANDHITGYWFSDLEPAWSPPADLVAFLEAGLMPIYIGFGSMAPGNAAVRTAIVVEALERAGLRGVLGLGWGGMEEIEAAPHVHFVHDVPHEWLFPRVQAVVHHGGSGTTHAGLRYGRPTLVCPLLGDQPFWGRRIAELGAGPEPLPITALNVDQLVEAIVELVSNEAYVTGARRIQDQITADGQSTAVQVIEAHAAVRATSRSRRADRRGDSGS
ncbi:glycosyltransferase [Tardiphaga sp. 1201_B9_N1_1]|uniref:glycosyltransferase n=1 Tax=unclassified Tardiphaga TaxID=2631404 RepID=UPI003F27E9CC